MKPDRLKFQDVLSNSIIKLKYRTQVPNSRLNCSFMTTTILYIMLK